MGFSLRLELVLRGGDPAKNIVHYVWWLVPFRRRQRGRKRKRDIHGFGIRQLSFSTDPSGRVTGFPSRVLSDAAIGRIETSNWSAVVEVRIPTYVMHNVLAHPLIWSDI